MQIIANKFHQRRHRLIERCILTLFILSLTRVVPCLAAEFVEGLPMTRSMFILHFTDGAVKYHELGQARSLDRITGSPLYLAATKLAQSYLISSPDDSFYLQPQHPSRVGRKSKGSGFTADGPHNFPYISDHWIYLIWPKALQKGKTYTIEFGGLARNAQEITIVYDDSLRSEAVHVNQIGYVPEARLKYGYVYAWAGDLGSLPMDEFRETAFHLVEVRSGIVRFSGRLTLRKDFETGGPDTGRTDEGPRNNYSGADVYECDFSSFRLPGYYRLVVEGIGASFPFRIDADVYRQAFHAAMTGLYHERCGTRLEPQYTAWSRDLCHHPDKCDSVLLSDWRFIDGGNAFGELPEYSTGVRAGYYGGWHDAGDWDRHHLHLEIGSFLLSVYEYAPKNFYDGELNIPEKDNGIPDIIDEARWGIDFFRRLQSNDGGVHGGIETFRHPADGVSSVTDTDQWYAYAEDPRASYHYAALACHLAYCLRLAGHGDEAPGYIDSALRAYQWAAANMRAGDETDVRDYRQYAAAWLYRLTGEAQYQQQFKIDNVISTIYTPLFLWQHHDQQWAVWTYISASWPNMDFSLKNRLQTAARNWARSNNLQTAQNRSCRVGYDWYVATMVGSATVPKTMPLIAAYQISHEAEFLDYQYTTCDYFLGGNPLNMCWISQTGDRFPKELMHLDSWYYHRDLGMAPGLIPYGPYHYDAVTTTGPFDPQFGMKTAYPAANLWPPHELYFENRYCPITNEFTVYQNMGPAAAAYGYLCAEAATAGITDGGVSADTVFELSSAYPNPFNDWTIIRYHLMRTERVRLRVFDLRGRMVRSLLDGIQAGGEHRMALQANNLASGVYFVVLQTEGQRLSRKVTLVR